jgi:hypothetical protein
MPATRQNADCRRRYKPGNNPLGTNPSCSSFYSDTLLLDKLDWSIINNRDFTTAERTRIKHAEALIPDCVMLNRIEGISVSSLVVAQEVNELIQSCGVANIVPLANYKPELFF